MSVPNSPKLAKPLLIDRLIVILEKYRGKGIGNYVFPVYTEKHVTDKQKMGRRNSFSTLVSETLDKVCEILGIDEKMTWYTARDTFYFQRNSMRALRLPMLQKWRATAPEPSRSTTTRIPSRKNCASA